MKSAIRRKASLAMLVVLAALGTAAVVHAATTPDFSLAVAPASQTVDSASSGSFAISVVPSNGFSGNVTLTAGNLPKGTAATWTVGSTTTSGTSVNVTVPAGSRGVAATVAIGGGQPSAGTYTPTVSAKSGSLSHSATLTLNVQNQNAANFALTASPSSATVAQGGSTSSSVAIGRNNFSGAVSFSSSPVAGLPAGATAAVSPSSTTAASASLTISAAASTAPGFYSLTLTGSGVLSGSASTRSAGLTLVVKGATTTSVAAPAAGATNAIIAANSISSGLSGGTSDAGGTITFKVFGPQPTAPSTCATGGVTVGTATVNGNGTYTSPTGYTPTTAGTYWWYASYSGNDYNSASASSCAAGMASTVIKNTTAASATAPSAATATAAISAASIGSTLNGATATATGTITYKVFGPQATAPSTCISGGATVGTATVNGNATYHPSAAFTPASGGTYWWYASYSGDTFNSPSTSACGSGMASTVVGDFSIGASPSSQTALSGGSTDDTAVYTVTDTPFAGFSGTVNLGVSGLPAGATASFSPATTSGAGAGNSTLTVDVGTSVPPGTYTLTIKGSATDPGTLSRSTQVGLVVQASQPFKVSGDVPSPLYPGSPAQSFTVTLTNPNGFAIHVTSLGAVTIQPVNAPGCLASWFQVTLPTVPSGGIAVPGSGGTVRLSATARMLDVNTVQDACKGKQLTLTYSGSYSK